MAQRIIDTHLHVWNFDKAYYLWLEGDTSILNRTHHIEEVEEEQKKVGVTGVVLVQSANNYEDTDWMLEVAERKESVVGVVGWLPLMQSDQTQELLETKYLRNKYFKGMRHLIHDETDPRWLLQEEVLESLKILAENNLPFDVVGVLPEHIETVLKVAQKVPSLKMVFDHLNHPPIASGEKFGRWGDLMKEASALPNFFAKISGLGTVTKKQDWSAEDIKSCVAFALENFGADRCFCGGDWPVSLLAGSYAYTWNVYKSVIDSLLPEAQREKVYAGNAVSFYNL
ncbi:amidohydrolase family protein [Flavisolibacter ginsenosidimutans]|uniref:Amidohydrolase family protein n=1 Tax=Flavisolibacter ginsenosidimutans TaxID=661481 RepID=A0A5B8UHP3_9BACT|nr:amidohydrolase family protein [Flavisolibacter ginsenosidimutans]QEC55659.1 amidohydrolase family protein [Flavisolibacter ginsenosidimutans]